MNRMKWYISNDSTKQAIRTDVLPTQLRGLFHPATLEEYVSLELYNVKITNLDFGQKLK